MMGTALDRTSGEGETLEQCTRAIHRLYLKALMRLDALGTDDGPAAGVCESEYATAQVEHELQFHRLNVLLVQLGYVPKDMATRAEIQRELAAQTPRPGRHRPERTTRAAARAEMSVTSA
jgi:hypothetical protein